MLGAWAAKEWIIFSVPFLLILIAVGIWFFLRKTIRTRLRFAKQLRDDPDINEWVVAFNWSRKVLYMPTIVASLAACVAMAFIEPGSTAAEIVGGVWLGVFFLNFLVDEYEVSVKILTIVVLCVGVVYLWLLLLGWEQHFVRFFTRLGVEINWKGYLLIAAIFSLAILVSWVRGLFYYVAITPNYLNVQVGPTESGHQIDREDYHTRIDTGDFLERLLGFGRVVITFRDQNRPAMFILVRGIGKVASRLESIRGKLAFDRHDSPGPEGMMTDGPI